MKCHLCGQPAVDRCYACGRLFCERHGQTNCSACAHGIAAGDPRPDRITADPASHAAAQRAWWRPQEADEYEPPSCYVCHGLARRVCQRCERRFCAEHAGNDYLCRECHRSSSIGLVAFGVLMVFVAALTIWGLIHPFAGGGN